MLKRKLWPALALFVIVAGFYWKLLLTNQYTWLDSPDLSYMVLPWLQFQAREWRLWHFPMWAPHELGGMPLVGQLQPGAAYPPNWLLFLAPLRDGFIRLGVLHWYFVLIHYMGALFCYLLCRDLKRSRGASIFAGLAFGLGGWIGIYDWPQILNGLIWAPLLFLFLLRATRGERPVLNGALAGTFLGISFLSGHHQFPVLLLLAAGGVWLFHMWRQPRVYLPAAAVFGVFVFLVSALQTFPAYEYGKLAVRWVNAPQPVRWGDAVPYYIHADYALTPTSIAGMIIPGLNKIANPFIGLAVPALAFLAIAVMWRDRAVRLFGAVALGALLYALGGYSVFQGVLYAVVPLLEKARITAFAIALFQFGLIVLTAFGIDHYLDSEERWSRALTRILPVISLLLFVLVVVLWLLQEPRGLDRERIALTAVSGLMLAALLRAWKREHVSRTAAVVLLTMLMLFEIGSTTGAAWQPRERWQFLTRLDQGRDLAKFLRAWDTYGRVEADDRDIPYSFGDYFGVDFIGGALTSVPADTYRVIGEYAARMLWGVKWHIGAKPSRPGQEEIFSGEGGLKVYVDPEAFPYAWSVHDVVSIPEDQINRNLERPLAELRRQAFIAGPAPELQACAAPDRITPAERHSNLTVVDVEMGCKGMVVVSENYYPGWRTTVDGRPAAVHKAYGFLRGVVVEAGRHRIVMRYRPTSVIWGGAFTFLGLLAAAIAPRLARRGTAPPRTKTARSDPS